MKLNLHFQMIILIIAGTVGSFAYSLWGSFSTPSMQEPLAHSSAATNVHIPDIPVIHEVLTHRDPFVAPIDENQVVSEATPSENEHVVASDSVPVLHGVVVGLHSYALVKDAGNERVVGIGDTLAGGTVRAITMNGVDLSNGLHLNANTPKT